MEKYPNGMSSFEAIRQGGYVYVDKTPYIRKLLAGSKYYFLGRPRRFGKSLFVSTLESFFTGRKELFRGLDIENYDWNWEPYPVMHIDFAPSAYNERWMLEQHISNSLEPYEKKYGIEISNPRDIFGRFNRLISQAHEQTGRQVVVLVDEYEKPVVDNIDNEEIKEYLRTILAGFYGVLKSLDVRLKLVFLTGVTKFGQMSIFSGLNNIRDISLLDEYGEICGITKKELLDNFNEGIQGIASEEGLDFNETLELLKRNYDGYHFSPKCPDIYNPFSIVNAMDNRAIGSYWAASGVPTLLFKSLQLNGFDYQDLNNYVASPEQLIGIDNQFDDPVGLFYQTGYLTIKEYRKRYRNFLLGFPNLEVEAAFYKYLLPLYSKNNQTATSSFINSMVSGFIDGQPEKAMKALKSFTAALSYEVLDKIKIEQHFENILFITLKVLLPYVSEVKSEERTSDGRMDITIKTTDYVYIIELKIDSTAKDALNQIVQKEYALQYDEDPRKVFIIGVNFSTEQRRINDWEILS